MGEYDLMDEEVLVVAGILWLVLMFLLWEFHFPLPASTKLSTKILTSILSLPLTWGLTWFFANRGD